MIRGGGLWIDMDMADFYGLYYTEEAQDKRLVFKEIDA